ncbi:MAG: hypothetical protein COX41_02925 [Candidatus Omnitrophica bacterium CG23_combo_of_CG06-09_8_20_14_all_41_10]|uniref:SHOCT domain-containing protein n=1 Tax=Candidatus Sherwoodlollariibacterium unditelluris TaxID=1974757 RepID=A0A2G9YLQ0_9BACT|nr:MAG: hypothetical protein COX41_02925 [Candidatus Omnitrophica bacterium CG23_combo_of_CG06-09_8_20_14_all_41_10]
MRFVRLSILILTVFLISGCVSQTFNIKNKGEAYDVPFIKDAPKAIVIDFTDLRGEKAFVGRVGLAYGKIDAPIPSILTDAIALRLRKEGFNVDKVLISRLGKQEIANILKNNEAKFLLGGGVEYFYFGSMDAIMEAAKGRVDFYVELFDTSGEKIFSQKYSSQSGKWMGFSARTGFPELIEQMLDASAEELFIDKEFLRVVELSNKDNGLVSEIDKLSKLHSSGALSDEEFKKAKSKVLDSQPKK